MLGSWGMEKPETQLEGPGSLLVWGRVNTPVQGLCQERQQPRAHGSLLSTKSLGGSCCPFSILDGKPWSADAGRDCQYLQYIGAPLLLPHLPSRPQTFHDPIMSVCALTPGTLLEDIALTTCGTLGNKCTYFQMEITPLKGNKIPRMIVASMFRGNKKTFKGVRGSAEQDSLSIRKRKIIRLTETSQV